MPPPERRVVVTGLGAVTPLGLDAASTWAGLVTGRSGVRPVTLVEAGDLPVRIAAEVPGFDPVAALGARVAHRLDRFAQFALVAAREAVAQSGLEVGRAPQRVATIVASGLGGVGTFERAAGVLASEGSRRVSPFLPAAIIGNAAVAAVSQDTGARGPSLCPTTACAAGTDAVGLGADLIRCGRADAVLAGGADAPVTRLLLAGFGAMRAASRRNDDPGTASRPFAEGRDGLVVGEGAGVLVLEERAAALARGAEPLAEVVGYAAASDAYHLTAPRPDGAGASAVVDGALAAAGLAAAEVGYVNAHGTSTRLNDEVEARVLTKIFGAGGVPVSSTKSMTGHLMGAAGAVEAVACVQVLRCGLLPPSVNADPVDPECAGLDLVRTTRDARPRVVLSTSFGFGGHDAALVLARA